MNNVAQERGCGLENDQKEGNYRNYPCQKDSNDKDAKLFYEDQFRKTNILPYPETAEEVENVEVQLSLETF